MSQDLKPCPFCGAEARWDEESGDWEILCPNRNCPLTFKGDDHIREELESAWNYRRNEATLTQQNDALRERVLAVANKNEWQDSECARAVRAALTPEQVQPL